MRNLTKHLGNIAVFVLAALLAYLIGAALVAGWPMWSAMPSMVGGGAGWLWRLVWLLLGGGLLSLVAWAAVSIFRAGPDDERTDPAEEILRQRFVRGEIDAEEYERRLVHDQATSWGMVRCS